MWNKLEEKSELCFDKFLGKVNDMPVPYTMKVVISAFTIAFVMTLLAQPFIWLFYLIIN